MLGRVVSDLVTTSRHCISASNFIASQLARQHQRESSALSWRKI